MMSISGPLQNNNSDSVKRFKKNQELNNPCLKEHNFSLKCLDIHNYDKDKCDEYFKNYKECKYFWNSIIRNRRRNNTYPVLPSVEEREKIRTEHFNKHQM